MILPALPNRWKRKFVNLSILASRWCQIPWFLWRKVSHEILVNFHSAELQDKCTSCHAPMGNKTKPGVIVTHSEAILLIIRDSKDRKYFSKSFRIQPVRDHTSWFQRNMILRKYESIPVCFFPHTPNWIKSGSVKFFNIQFTHLHIITFSNYHSAHLLPFSSNSTKILKLLFPFYIMFSCPGRKAVWILLTLLCCRWWSLLEWKNIIEHRQALLRSFWSWCGKSKGYLTSNDPLIAKIFSRLWKIIEAFKIEPDDSTPLSLFNL